MNVLEAMNEQMNFELESAYLYRGMEAYLASQEMDGMKHFMAKQVQEEIEHAEKMGAFLEDLGMTLKFRPLDPGEQNYASIAEVFRSALDHEQIVTENIEKLVDMAAKENNKAAFEFLQWYIREQVEEEATFSKINARLERIHDDWGGLYMLDGVLGQRA